MSRSVARVLIALVFALAGCQAQDDDAPLFDHAALVREVERAGARVEASGPVSQPFFSVSGRTMAVNGQTVQTFEYRDVASAEAEARTVSADGGTIGTSAVSWVSTPHFFHRDRLIALYVGEDSNIRSLLTGIMGPQFAGR